MSEKTILDTIGHTPMVELVRMNPNPAVRLFVKLEGNNPGGSVKDRIALSMIEGAQKRGELKPGMIILEATSGNTGIGISLVAACKGYWTVLTMSEGVSIERRRMQSALGAEIVLTPEIHGTDGAIVEARRMLEDENAKIVMFLHAQSSAINGVAAGKRCVILQLDNCDSNWDLYLVC